MSHLLPGEDVDLRRGACEPRPAQLHFESWAGRIIVRVTVIGETPKRYRVRYEEAFNGNHGGQVGAVRLVPKRAVSFVWPPPETKESKP